MRNLMICYCLSYIVRVITPMRYRWAWLVARMLGGGSEKCIQYFSWET